MRMRERDLVSVYVAPPVDGGKTPDGYPKKGFGERTEIKVNLQAGTSALQAKVYGDEISKMKLAIYQGDVINELQSEKWGVWLNDDLTQAKPHFLIDSIETFSTHKNVMLKKVI